MATQAGAAAIVALKNLTASEKHYEVATVSASRIRPPETDEEARKLKEWAARQPIHVQPATFEQISQHLDFIKTVLPTQKNDEISGKMRVTVYASILSDFTNDALAYMVNRACRELDWFPTPRQCLEILKDWQQPVSVQERVNSLCLTYWQGRFDAFIDALKDGSATILDLENAQERWKRIAVDRGHLRRMDDGSYVIRSKWHGPIFKHKPAPKPEREPLKYCDVCLFSSRNAMTKTCKAPNCGLRAWREEVSA